MVALRRHDIAQVAQQDIALRQDQFEQDVLAAFEVIVDPLTFDTDFVGDVFDRGLGNALALEYLGGPAQNLYPS